MKAWFDRFAARIATLAGSPWAFAGAALSIVFWAASGPVLRFSDTWQLYANTATTLVTFVMVFLIQSAQNRDAAALHLKMNELLRAVEDARPALMDAEDLPADEIEDRKREIRRDA